MSARERIMVGAASHEEAIALKCVTSTPVAVVQRVYTDSEGRVVYAGWSVYRGDRFLVERELFELVHGNVTRLGQRSELLGEHQPPVRARLRKASAA